PEEVLHNPVLDLLLLENPNLLAEARPESRNRLLGSPACWPEFVRWALKHGDEDALLALCRNPRLPREAIEALQNHPTEKVRQAARLQDLLHAHERARAAGIEATDDAALLEWAGLPVKAVLGSYENLKITRPVDLALAAALLRWRREHAGHSEEERA
ncbi:MAG: hypothetical protein C4289_04430, partial [Chloroflexota bacterium]